MSSAERHMINAQLKNVEDALEEGDIELAYSIAQGVGVQINQIIDQLFDARSNDRLSKRGVAFRVGDLVRNSETGAVGVIEEVNNDWALIKDDGRGVFDWFMIDCMESPTGSA